MGSTPLVQSAVGGNRIALLELFSLINEETGTEARDHPNHLIALKSYTEADLHQMIHDRLEGFVMSSLEGKAPAELSDDLAAACAAFLDIRERPPVDVQDPTTVPDEDIPHPDSPQSKYENIRTDDDDVDGPDDADDPNPQALPTFSHLTEFAPLTDLDFANDAEPHLGEFSADAREAALDRVATELESEFVEVAKGVVECLDVLNRHKDEEIGMDITIRLFRTSDAGKLNHSTVTVEGIEEVKDSLRPDEDPTKVEAARRSAIASEAASKDLKSKFPTRDQRVSYVLANIPGNWTEDQLKRKTKNGLGLLIRNHYQRRAKADDNFFQYVQGDRTTTEPH